MGTIGGKERESQESIKKVGLFEATVIAINPSEEEYKDVLGFELKEESKATEYLGESKDGNTYLRLAVWVKNIKSEEKFCITFFLEDKIRTNKDGSKKQYINNVGTCSWADEPENLPEWFTKREYREAHAGEEELYEFLRTWLGKLDYRDEETVLELDWKKMMKGNVKELKEQLDSERWTTTVGVVATIVAREKEGEIKEYQNIYNRAFLPAYALKYFRLVDYQNEEVLEKLKKRKSSDLKFYEKFALRVTDSEHGIRDYFTLKDLKEYSPEENIVASDKVIDEPPI